MALMDLDAQQMSSNEKPFYAVMFVCLGNICRSPTAEAILRHLAKQQQLDPFLHIESSATRGWNLGEAPDRRSSLAAQKRGFQLSGQSTLFQATDFDRFHYILGADAEVVEQIKLETSIRKNHDKVHLITFCSEQYKNEPIPDPYYEGEKGFELVLDMLEDSCLGLLKHLYKTP